MRTIIKNGQIVTDSEVFKGDLLIEDEKIIEVGESIECGDAGIIDAEGMYVLPGAVDVHTHMDLDVGFARAIDDFYDGTVAAACGGTTTIVDHMAFGPKDCSLWHQVNEYHRLADGNAVVDYGFHGVFQHVNEDTFSEMKEIKEEEGITSFKVYLTYDYRLEDEDVFRVLRAAKEAGVVITVHCENHGVITRLRKEFPEQGKTEAKYHPLSRPARCEAEAVNRMIHIAAMAGDAPLYIVHLSSAEGLHEVMKARAENRPNLGVETCIQYLLLNDSAYDDPQEGLKAIMSPPLRKDRDREELWKALADGGIIDTVATDHCPFHFKEGKAEKQYGKDDFTKCPNGAPGVQERLMLLFSEGFMKGRISLPQVVKYASSEPCRMFGMYPQKGSLEPGTDADIVIIDPSKKTLIDREYIRGASDYSCYEGMTLDGSIERVFLRGSEIARNGRFTGKRGDGRYLRRGESVLASKK
ncbi:MAG: dihydropyrimidinase [Mogibacterium sp.]|nr:dihydropyrimidinase [Mogibacterium sp.]